MLRRSCSFMSSMGLLVISMLAALSSVSGSACPPEGLTTISTLDLESFASSPFFIVKVQAPAPFTPLDALFCLRIDYNVLEENPLACRAPRCDEISFLSATNTGNLLSVDGPSNLALDALPVLASVRDPEEPAQLFTGFSFLPERVYSRSLFVYAAGTFEELETLSLDELAQDPRSNQYDWAVIAGSPVSIDTGNGCLSGATGFANDKNLFLYSRDPTPSQEIIDQIEAVASFLGFDTSVLVQVEQEGCTYPPLSSP